MARWSGCSTRGSSLKRTIIAAICGLAMLSLVSTASAAIRITKIYYNPPGADTGSNSSLNAEWISIRNTGTRARQLLGWKILDADGHRFRIGDFRLPAQTTFKLRTGSGLGSYPSVLYWGMSNYVWNNNGDTARLKNRAGTVVDRCHYAGGGSYVRC
jgi:hypothetical protein